MGLGSPRSRVARERTCGDEHVGQHVKRTQVRTVENKEETTAAPTTKNLQQVKRATTVGKSGPTAGEKSIANCRQGLGQYEVQDKDQDEAKFKISVGMSVMNCADITDAKNLSIMTEKASEAA